MHRFEDKFEKITRWNIKNSQTVWSLFALTWACVENLELDLSSFEENHAYSREIANTADCGLYRKVWNITHSG